LPLGVQLVGRRGNDARLLRSARWLVKTLERGTPGHGAQRRTRKSAATANAGGPRRSKGKAP
jgi:Asp-tRNA(Asn)/Glu-tRNA(Gln) amidotransferase A subunit family amidase